MVAGKVARVVVRGGVRLGSRIDGREDSVGVVVWLRQISIVTLSKNDKLLFSLY